MSELDDDQRKVFTGLADILVPADSGMPVASDVDVPGALIDKALRFRPDLIPPFLRALALADDMDALQAVEMLAAGHPDEFGALTLLTTGAYYLSGEVRQRLNLNTGVPRPVHDDTDQYIDMLERVVERGPIFRST